MSHPELLSRMDRRKAIQWMLTATATMTVRDTLDAAGSPAAAVHAKGYGPDPSMVTIYKPGDVWPLTLTEPSTLTPTRELLSTKPAVEEKPRLVPAAIPEPSFQTPPPLETDWAKMPCALLPEVVIEVPVPTVTYTLPPVPTPYALPSNGERRAVRL